ncbi:MAG: aminoglycoside phosphotransferase family protein [Verrucomicrobiae bacterium]|nr:aminoglycoside phosphotransferase family protein [Verrucomicrobiae bacterium]
MRLGIDFDNTIVCYDELFRKLAVEDGSIAGASLTTKTAIRDSLRSAGREAVWTRMQGVAYGPRLGEAKPFPGVLGFIRLCIRAGWHVFIISHKTRFPYLGERHDLHAAAWAWIERVGLLGGAPDGLSAADVFFEGTKEAKLERIRSCECDFFVDDLPEFLGDPRFPEGVQRILFDPSGEHGADMRFCRMRNWVEADELVGLTRNGPGREGIWGDGRDRFLVPLLKSAGIDRNARWEVLTGGANNRVWRIEGPRSSWALKEYFSRSVGGRDRFESERAFYEWLRVRGIGNAPVPVGWDEENRLGLFEWVEGRRVAVEDVGEDLVRMAIRFVADVNRGRGEGGTGEIPHAAEACFRICEHVACIEDRVRRLERLEDGSELYCEAGAWIRETVRPAWEQTLNVLRENAGGEWDRSLTDWERCLSPSDFGFHNALLRADGRATFFDFEYAGWDDPAKLAVDFLWQPRVRVPRVHWNLWIRGLDEALGWKGALRRRAGWLWPAYRVKWCCIVMNEFLRSGRERRVFSTGGEGWEDRLRGQLEKARVLMAGWRGDDGLGAESEGG